MKPGDKVSFTHPKGHQVVGTLVAIEDGFYVIDDGVTRPIHRLAARFAAIFDFQVIDSDETSHAE